MTHKKINRFQLEGSYGDDSDIVRLKEKYIQTLQGDMRMDGYVPVLAIDPAFSTVYDGKNYNFLLTIHGVYVGKQKAQIVYGIDGQKEIPME